jgi:putative membrane protein
MLSEQQAKEIEQAIVKAEARTDGELVTVLARRSDDYLYIPVLWAALVALMTPAVLLFSPLWLSAGEVFVLQLAVFLGLVLILRFPPLLHRIIPPGVKRWRAGNLARRQFLENNLHHTRGETGVLIFVSQLEHYVEIIADRGIDAHVDEAQWQAIVDQFVIRVRKRETLEGFLGAIESCGELLSQHAPVTSEHDELPNRLILL